MMMGAQDAADPIGALLNLHHVLEVEHNDGDKGNFLFGWQCENSFANDLIARTAERSSSRGRALELPTQGLSPRLLALAQKSASVQHNWLSEPQ